MSLTKLIEAVERGEWPGEINGIARAVFPYNEDWRKDHGVMAHEAFDGSLDAAKQLHDALLPGWGGAAGYDYYTGMCRSTARVSHMGESYRACIDDLAQVPRPSRAWLLAILRALEQEGRE